MSDGAKELAEKLLRDERVHYFSQGQFKYCPTGAAALIDAELRDLVEAARAFAMARPFSIRTSPEGEKLDDLLNRWQVK